MLAIARALMSSPRLLLLDEPSLGLAPTMVETVFRVIAEIRRQGVTVLMVEQNAARAAPLGSEGKGKGGMPLVCSGSAGPAARGPP
jgi:branched-chain amino acid transport system ATP-binding protein